MLDVARAILLVVALVHAVRHRFLLGIVTGLALAALLSVVAVAAWRDMSAGAISGEDALAFAYIGPTMVPFGHSMWLPSALQALAATLAGVPALRVLRDPSAPHVVPFLALFVASAMLAVVTALAAFLLWHQKIMAPEDWGVR